MATKRQVGSKIGLFDARLHSARDELEEFQLFEEDISLVKLCSEVPVPPRKAHYRQLTYLQAAQRALRRLLLAAEPDAAEREAAWSLRAGWWELASASYIPVLDREDRNDTLDREWTRAIHLWQTIALTNVAFNHTCPEENDADDASSSSASSSSSSPYSVDEPCRHWQQLKSMRVCAHEYLTRNELCLTGSKPANEWSVTDVLGSLRLACSRVDSLTGGLHIDLIHWMCALELRASHLWTLSGASDVVFDDVQYRDGVVHESNTVLFVANVKFLFYAFCRLAWLRHVLGLRAWWSAPGTRTFCQWLAPTPSDSPLLHDAGAHLCWLPRPSSGQVSTCLHRVLQYASTFVMHDLQLDAFVQLCTSLMSALGDGDLTARDAMSAHIMGVPARTAAIREDDWLHTAGIKFFTAARVGERSLTHWLEAYVERVFGTARPHGPPIDLLIEQAAFIFLIDAMFRSVNESIHWMTACVQTQRDYQLYTRIETARVKGDVFLVTYLGRALLCAPMKVVGELAALRARVVHRIGMRPQPKSNITDGEVMYAFFRRRIENNDDDNDEPDEYASDEDDDDDTSLEDDLRHQMAGSVAAARAKRDRAELRALIASSPSLVGYSACAEYTSLAEAFVAWCVIMLRSASCGGRIVGSDEYNVTNLLRTLLDVKAADDELDRWEECDSNLND